MIALRAPLYLELGIATALTAGLWLIQPTAPGPSAPELPAETPAEQLDIRSHSIEHTCDADNVVAIVIRGQFTSHERLHEGFAISFAGTEGRYTAFTDRRGYFEVRIPHDDFVVDLCELPSDARSFSDESMTLRYRLDFE